MDLDLAAVRTVVAVADEGQFSHAAAVLGISQQSVSKRIAKIEAQLGPLFERTATGATPTALGARFLPHARAVLAAADAAIRAIRRPLRVAIHGESIADAELMRFYASQRPDADFETVVPNTLTTAPDIKAFTNTVVTPRSAVIGGRVDVALARAHWAAEPLPAGITSVPAYLEPFHLLVGKDHPLATRTSVTLEDMRAYPAWVPGAAIRSEWADYYRELSRFSEIDIETGQRPEPMGKIVERVANSPTLMTFIGEGTSTPWHPNSRRLPITNPTPAYPFALLWLATNRHPELPHLIDHITTNYNDDTAADCWIPAADRALFAPHRAVVRRNGSSRG
ncbi:LysR family transcriptional regulator [Nocardia sp. CA-128927]|uniref:LysR family transcriptional regulator n=1 Tax=Nocardia sp. CA-128927 TaxID=3239975 RepID=UPI003D95E49A